MMCPASALQCNGCSVLALLSLQHISFSHNSRRLLPRLQLDPAAAAEFAELQVHLYAEYAPQQLLEFLSVSQYYPLEAALEVVTQKGMVPEQVSR
jgi:hypothetical protein